MKKVLLKLSGELLTTDNTGINKSLVEGIAHQIKTLQNNYFFSIVIGGGNFFRGGRQAEQFGISRSSADTVGMLATLMNGVILRDLFASYDVKTKLLSALPAPTVAQHVSQQAIDAAQEEKCCIIFAGGTGMPYFSTDTNAVVRALQLGANWMWKATNVNYVYSADPNKDTSSKPLEKLSYDDILTQNLEVMDKTAVILAQHHKLPIRVFNLFETNALLQAANDGNFGSTISSFDTPPYA